MATAGARRPPPPHLVDPRWRARHEKLLGGKTVERRSRPTKDFGSLSGEKLYIMNTRSCVCLLFAHFYCAASFHSFAAEPSVGEQLVLACYHTEVHRVVVLLRAGADVNARVEQHDPEAFRDPQTLGVPMLADSWTPLLALANSLRLPDPGPVLRNTREGPVCTRKQHSLPAKKISRRNAKRQQILMILLSHNCEIDAADSGGATALYYAIANRHSRMAKLLILYGADVNIRVGSGMDGPGGRTPLHAAYWSDELTTLLLENGANDSATDSEGRTPRDLRRDSAAVEDPFGGEW